MRNAIINDKTKNKLQQLTHTITNKNIIIGNRSMSHKQIQNLNSRNRNYYIPNAKSRLHTLQKQKCKTKNSNKTKQKKNQN